MNINKLLRNEKPLCDQERIFFGLSTLHLTQTEKIKLQQQKIEILLTRKPIDKQSIDEAYSKLRELENEKPNYTRGNNATRH